MSVKRCLNGKTDCALTERHSHAVEWHNDESRSALRSMIATDCTTWKTADFIEYAGQQGLTLMVMPAPRESGMWFRAVFYDGRRPIPPTAQISEATTAESAVRFAFERAVTA